MKYSLYFSIKMKTRSPPPPPPPVTGCARLIIVSMQMMNTLTLLNFRAMLSPIFSRKY